MSEIRLTVLGAPRTKKNHGRLIKTGVRHRLLPSKAWTTWSQAARIVCAGHDLDQITRRIPFLKDRPYNVTAIFYRDRDIGDAVGYYQGLADLLEKRAIVSNDKWFVSWDGSRLKKDKENPRVEIILTAAPMEGATQ